ncbi:flippase [uncultured Sulfurimonas sp.]|jgi:O-antigen/teichoic acid export membrane protein|uniref:flippase n=1 Tax=uncultured Sulfurimonas sp. TaxID=291845 RepID=UPI0032B2E80B
MPNSFGFKKYISNTAWLFAEKVLRIGMGLFITVWMARYLGPEQFGMLNYAISFTALFGILSSLGLNTLATRELLTNPQDSQYIMGTSFLLSFVGAIVLLPIAVFSVSVVRPDNELIFIMVLIISSTFFFKSFSVIKYWFESHVQAKYSVIVEALLVFISAFIKGTLIYLEAPLVAFAWAVLVESILMAFGLIAMYLSKSNKIFSWKVSFEKSKYLLKKAYPLILAGGVYVFFTRIDQVMLGSMVGDESVGIYAVAVRLSEGWIFVPGIIAISFFPAMLNARKKDYSLYLQRTQHLLNLMVLLGVLVAIGTTFIASPLVNLIFGQHYEESSLVLVIHIWGMVFTAISIISFRYFLSEGLQIYSFYRAFVGLILNIVLNYFLIPIYGAVGAAIATAISQMVAVWLLNSISPKTRIMFFMQTKALSLFGSINTLKHVKSLKG